jgi:type VI secretion system protein ImpJ
MSENPANRVAWSEGMFLQPQHLQQAEAGADARLAGHLRLLDPLHWGIAELAIDEDALAHHQIAIQRLTAVAPCGTLLRVPDHALIAARAFDPTASIVSVHIGLRRRRVGELAAAAEDERGPVRFRIRSVAVSDLCQAEEPVDLPLLFPEVRVLLAGKGGELDGHDVLKLLEIEATGSPARPFRIRSGFVPPLLHVQAWPALHERIESLRLQMLGRAVVLSAARGGLERGDARRALLALVLGRAASALGHRLAAPVHPRDVYAIVLQAAVELALLGGAQAPADLPVYAHEDLHGCFAPLLELVQRELAREFRDRTREHELRFSREHDAYVASGLGADVIDRRNAFYLAVRSELPVAELVRLVATEGKLGSASGVRFLTTLAVAGLRVEPLPAPPLELPTRPGCVFFQIDPASSGSQWSKLREEGSLGVHLGKLDGADVRLFIVSPEE